MVISRKRRSAKVFIEDSLVAVAGIMIASTFFVFNSKPPSSSRNGSVKLKEGLNSAFFFVGVLIFGAYIILNWAFWSWSTGRNLKAFDIFAAFQTFSTLQDGGIVSRFHLNLKVMRVEGWRVLRKNLAEPHANFSLPDILLLMSSSWSSL